MACDRYVSNKMVRDALAASGSIETDWHLDQLKLLAADLESLRADLQLVAQVSAGDFREIDARNDGFVAREIELHDEFFRNVESSVLDRDQRLATIVMEDCNLVVAAAGSGKSSTLVAKVGYLVKKGYASPEEILVLSFNKSVANELSSRINEYLVKPGRIEQAPAVKTFHSFGMKAINQTGPAVRLAPLAQSSELRRRELQKIFLELIDSDKQFQVDAIRFLALYSVSGAVSEASDLASQFGKSWRNLMAQPVGTIALPDPGSSLYTTLSGDVVRSKQELQIANWLTLMGIEFVYEKPFPKVASHPWTHNYRPDFFYPGLNLWHEHFGINAFGKAPLSWAVNSVGMSYEQQVDSKRQMLQSVGVKWFETTSGDFETGEWENKLRTNLERAGAKPQLIGWERFTELAASAGLKHAQTTDLLGAAIAHFKSNHLSLSTLRDKASASLDAGRSEAFIRLFEKVYSRYEAMLSDRGQIDFDDMLRISAQRLRASPTTGHYKAILIDEFQDMSTARAELVKALLHHNPQATLFAVGDDWQSVYRFAGSDITVMTQFEKHFGFTRQVNLSTTYRCNQGLVDVSGEFIRKNPNQIKKSVSAVSKLKSGVVRVVFHAGSADSALVNQLDAIATWAQSRSIVADVCLIGRYNYLEPTNFTALADRFKGCLNLSFSTAHRAKGLGYDFVIVLGMSCKRGSDFPSTREDDPLLALFMPVADALPYAEERRLFYVALTRARRACILLAPKFGASSFVLELLRSKFPDALRSIEISQDIEAEVPDPLSTAMQQVCPECGRGRLLPRVGPYGPFMVCERKDKGLSVCASIRGHLPPGQSTVARRANPRRLNLEER